METWKDIASVIESLATAGALIVAGVWTYLTFVRQRLGLPRLNATISPRVVAIPHGRMLRTQIMLQNNGTVVATSTQAELRLRQVVPMPFDVSELVRTGYDPVQENSQIEWPLLVARKWQWDKGAFEIEPGESDTLCADFFISEEPQVVEFYFYLANAAKKRQNVGWTATMILELSSTEASMSEKAGGEPKSPGGVPTIDYRPLQQRPREPQTQQQPQPPQQQQTKVKPK